MSFIMQSCDECSFKIRSDNPGHLYYLARKWRKTYVDNAECLYLKLI
jgi:hypothetical protein